MISKRLLLAIVLLLGTTVGAVVLQRRLEAGWGSLVAVFGAAAAILVVLPGLIGRMRSLEEQAHEDRVDIARLLAAELHSLQNLAMLFPGIHMPVSTFSMRASNLEALADILIRRRPRIVVELGS